MSLASVAVRFAAWTLPRRIRDRYREQWLADLRDAGEAGIRTSEIAIGSLAFAATLARPIMSGSHPPAESVIVRRERLASALALSCAIITMSNLGGVVSHQGLTGNGIYDFITFLAAGLAFLYFALALVAAFVLVAATRGVSSSIRWAVCLLIAATLSGFAFSPFYSLFPELLDANIYVGPALTFGVSLVLSLVASVLLVRHFRHRDQSRPVHRARAALALVGAGVPLVVVALGIAHLVALRSALQRSDIAFIEGILATHPQEAGRIAAMEAYGNHATADAIVFWGTASALVCVAVGLVGYLWPRHAVARTLALLCVLLISHAGILDYIWLFSFGGAGVHPVVPEEVALLVGRWGLVAIALYTVGGLRLARLRHRRDVERAVELLKG